MKFLRKILPIIPIVLIVLIFAYFIPITKGSGRYYYKLNISDLNESIISDAKYYRYERDIKRLRDLYKEIQSGDPESLEITNMLMDVDKKFNSSFEVLGTIDISESIYGIINFRSRDIGTLLYITIDLSNSCFGLIAYPEFKEDQEINISLQEMYKIND